MDIVSIWSSLAHASVDEFLVWGVAAFAGLIAVVALVNALDMFIGAETG